MNQLKVSTRLAWGFGFILVLLMVVSGFSALQLRSVNDNVVYLAQNTMPSLTSIAVMRDRLGTIRRLESQHILVNTNEQMETLEKRIVEARKSLDTEFDKYRNYFSDAEDERLWGLIQTNAQAYYQAWERVRVVSRRTLTDPNASEEAQKLYFGPSSQIFETANDGLEKIWAYNVKLGQERELASHASYVKSLTTLGLLTAAACALSMVGALLITRSITRQLGGEPTYAAEVAKEIAAGNLAVAVRTRSGDEGSLLAAMRLMQDSLVRVVSNVRQGSESVSTASAEIAQGNSDLSARTESQASALEETAASMEELGSTVKQNADNAKQANQLAQNASTVAVKGGEVVAQVVDTMKGINDSSKKIADIISVIDGIAFQTNILALNAAVEAARAGEQGRGFAVVASEVRSLAGRSADAAKEIKTLITDSVSRVEQGSALVDQAGTTMNEVVASIRRVTDIMGEISAASAEQSAGVAQVGEAVVQMDQATQQNAALVEEMAAAASSLKGQAQELVQAVAVFKLAQGDSGVAHAPRAAGKTAAVNPARTLAPPTTAAKKVGALAAAPAPAKASDAKGDWESF